MNKNTKAILGGIFGILSVVAAIYQVLLSGYDKVSIAGAIQSISGTMLNVMVLFLVFKNFYEKKIGSFEDRLKSRLKKWTKDNRNIIKKSNPNKVGFYGYDMFTDMNNFYKKSNSKNSGWFVRLPDIKESNYNKGNIKIYFHLNKGTFFEGMGLKDEELGPLYKSIASNIKEYITDIYDKKELNISYDNQTITIIIVNPIQTNKEINFLIRVLDSMVKAYLVSANIKL